MNLRDPGSHPLLALPGFDPGDPGMPEVAVVVASIDARGTVAESLARFLEEVGDRGEVILVDASNDGTAEEAERLFPDVRVIRRPAGRLAPTLWRDGLRSTEAPLVALSTAQMVPAPGWLDALRGRLEATGAAVAGGPIEPSPALGADDRALYLLRYVNYLRPLPADPAIVEPPGDNALYQSAALRGLESSWERGFWEVEVHRKLRERGERLVMSDDAVVEFRGGMRLGEAFRQRRRHARIYGAARASRSGRFRGLARLASAPLVVPVLLRRIGLALAARGQALGPWLSSLPALCLLLAAWSLGEAEGTWRYLVTAHAPARSPIRGGTGERTDPGTVARRRRASRRARRRSTALKAAGPDLGDRGRPHESGRFDGPDPEEGPGFEVGSWA